MALWDRITSRGDVEDRRGMGPALALGGGGLGLGGIVLLVALNLLGGGDVSDVLSQLPNVQLQTQGQGQQQAFGQQDFSGTDDYEVFASKVLGSANDMWSDTFSAAGKTYSPPKLVLFRGATQGGCGLSSSDVGPHYCPRDRTIYLDETFFEELQNRFKAKGGDVAEAYVIAHEVGHHAQNELGIMDQAGSSGLSATGEDSDSVKLELQADCFAGLWAHYVDAEGVFEPGEISEALDAASAVGDDRIQRATQGRVTPETWTHGSSAERMTWFNRGYESGQVSRCNTFGS